MNTILWLMMNKKYFGKPLHASRVPLPMVAIHHSKIITLLSKIYGFMLEKLKNP